VVDEPGDILLRREAAQVHLIFRLKMVFKMKMPRAIGGRR
jgi:hypothetical protein